MGQETMVIHGDLKGTSFVPWIRQHARKLGLAETIRHADADRIEVDLTGPAELIDAMEMGCLLGPIDIWVETIQRQSNTAGRAAVQGGV